MERLVAALVALYQVLKPYIPHVVAYFVGRKVEKDAHEKQTLKAVAKAAKAVKSDTAVTTDDRLRKLAASGRLRRVRADKPAGE